MATKKETESYKALLKELVSKGKPSALLINETEYLDAERLTILEPPSYLYSEAPLQCMKTV